MIFRKPHFVRATWIVALAAALAFPAFSQGKKRNVARGNKPPVAASKDSAGSGTAPEKQAPEKRNARPDTPADMQGGGIAASRDDDRGIQASAAASYSYEFIQRDFTVSRIIIVHDDNGKGTISFQKRGLSEMFSDPLQVAPAAMERIWKALAALNFLDSTESYQHEKDFSNLGTVVFKLRKDSRERTATFNYTANKDARALADEYRKLSNQFLWVFDITVARENQPLDTPGLLDALNSLFRRNEISDKEQMVPLLREVANDERIPLIARNHAERLIKQIEMEKK